MKIRIRGNSVRFRLTKNEVEKLCETGFIEEQTNFSAAAFKYSVVLSEEENLSIDFKDNRIELSVSEEMLKDWNTNDRIGFSNTVHTENGETIEVFLEKDFTCLDERGEDESNNYPNPKAQVNHGK